MLPDVPSTNPSASIFFAAASTASGVVVGETIVSASATSPTVHLRVGQVRRRLASGQGVQTLGHQEGVVRLHVVGGAAYVRGEDHVRHGHERVVGGERLAFEVVE